jgi:TorA maturation chaperone TorD
MMDTLYQDPYLRSYQILAAVARERACMYRWLALSFYPPDAGLTAAVRGEPGSGGQMLDELRRATRWLGQDQVRLEGVFADIARDPEALASGMPHEYQRLFGKSIDRVSARESTYSWRTASHMMETQHDLHQSLHSQYHQFGLKPLPGWEDHLAVELEFMAYLCQREAACWQAGQDKTARELRKQESTFMEQHLGAWVPEFTQRVLARQPHSFYGRMAHLAHLWLGLDHGPGYLNGKA